MIFGRHVNKYYFKYWYLLLFGMLAVVVVDIAQLEIPNNYGYLIDYLESGTLTKELLYEILLNIFIVLGLLLVGRFLWRICLLGVGIKVERDLRKEMFIHTTTLSQVFFQTNKTGAQMALYTNDIQNVRACFDDGSIMVVDALFLGVFAFVKMCTLNVTLAIISAIPLLLLALCGGVIGKYMDKKWDERQKAFEDLSDFTQENFSGISVIKAFVKEGLELVSFTKINKDNEEKNLSFVKFSTLLSILINLLISSILIIIIGYGSFLVRTVSSFSIGDLSRFIAYFNSLIWPMMAVAQLINLRAQGKASLNRIAELLDRKPIVVDEEVVSDHEFKGEITFNHLNFTYPLSENIVLKDMSFNISAGETVGIIGKTGTGKTTIVDILTRIYNVDKNTVFLDGVDIMDLPIHDVRNAISYVPQDNFLFGDTIIKNIGFSKEDISLEEAKYYAQLAGVSEDIEGFKEEYFTVIGERGVTLSGGQKQRISIARALAKDSKILILDDSVSAVDTKTETTILANLEKIKNNRTIILIAHRISTVINADKIILIDDGKVINVGTHQELLENEPMYAEIVHLQELEAMLVKEGDE